MSAARQAYIELVEETYFGSVVRRDMDAILGCFSADAVVTIRHGDDAPRLFHQSPGPGEVPLSEFYAHLLAQFDPWFGDYQHYYDPIAHTGASRFQVRLTPRPGQQVDAQHLFNCNFFELEGEKIRAMLIYYSNPGANAQAATGYPGAGAALRT
jgi:hypothetical protein